MTVKSAMNVYRKTLKKIKAYNYALGIIYYDMSTVAPEMSRESRAKASEVLIGESYALETGKKFVEAVKFLVEHKNELSETERREIELYSSMQLEYIASIPQDEYIANSLLLDESESVWAKAKEENNYSLFEPYLEKIFANTKKFAHYYRSDISPYDVMLDRHEGGITSETLDRFFALLRERIVPLVEKISQKPQIDDSFVYRNYPIELQRKFSDELMKVLTLDRKRCTIGETEHPFTTEFSKNDVRITTHYYEDNLFSSMYSVIHEGGHALYELGGGDEYEGTALSGGVSMGIHESQSRFFENIIGRSRAFTSVAYKIAKEIFPEQLSDVSEEDFFLAANKCQPSLIRTDADEVTYSMHIMVRYEIEKGIFDGLYTTKDVPRVFAEKMKKYLGVDVPSDSEGALQDVHWAGGMIGYFPSYALGSAYGAQFYSAICREIDVEKAVSEGNIKAVVDILTDKIYRHSSMYKPSQLIEMVCGEPFDPMYYIEYLENKYKEIYNL